MSVAIHSPRVSAYFRRKTQTIDNELELVRIESGLFELPGSFGLHCFSCSFISD